MSLWSWVNRSEELSKFQNPLFEANSLVIWPSVAPQSLQLWEGKPGLLFLLQAIFILCLLVKLLKGSLLLSLLRASSVSADGDLIPFEICYFWHVPSPEA